MYLRLGFHRLCITMLHRRIFASQCLGVTHAYPELLFPSRRLKLLRMLSPDGFYVKFFSVYLICGRIQTSKSKITDDYRALIRTIILHGYRQLCRLLWSRRKSVYLHSLPPFFLSQYILVYDLYPSCVVEEYLYASAGVEPLKPAVYYRPERLLLIHEIYSDICLDRLLRIYKISAERLRVHTAKRSVTCTLCIYILSNKYPSALTQDRRRLLHPVVSKSYSREEYRGYKHL